MSDREATVLANDLVVALKAAGWDANYLAGMGGGGIQNSVPIVMGVKNQDKPALEAGALQGALKTALGFPIPGIIDNTLPDNEVDIALISHPVRRPK